MPYKDPAMERAKKRAWALANPEKVRATMAASNRKRADLQRAWCLAHPEKVRASRLMINYGLTLAEWDAMLIAQCGRCAICSRPMIGYREPAVDHDHDTKVVRELLCGPCNQAIGLLRDDPFVARMLVDYLLKHRK